MTLRREKVKQRVQYVQKNIFKKLFFKKKFYAFLHLKQVTNKRQMLYYVMNTILGRQIMNQNKILSARFQKWRNDSKCKIKKSKEKNKLAIIAFRLKKFFNGTFL